MLDLILKIESYGFECEAGPLTKCVDWNNLRAELAKCQQERDKALDYAIYDCATFKMAYQKGMKEGAEQAEAELAKCQQELDEQQWQIDYWKKESEKAEALTVECRTALEPVTLWLKSALECESFRWDNDQRACAEDSLEEAKQALSNASRRYVR